MKFPRVNWRRGFFRVWVLLAGLWFLVFTAWSVSAALNPYVSSKDFAVNRETGQVDLIDQYGEPHNSLRTAVTDGKFKAHEVRPDWTLYVRSDSPAADLPVRLAAARALADHAIAAQRTEAIWRTASYWFWGALFWPLVVLALGAAIGWALSGFRRTA